MMVASISIGGSRSLSQYASLLAYRIGQILVRRGNYVSVGCARGADEAALRGAAHIAPLLVRIYAVGEENGEGFYNSQIPDHIKTAVDLGCHIMWSAGGIQGNIRQRLAKRSAHCVSSGVHGAIFVIGTKPSVGSWGAAKVAVKHHIPLYVCPVDSVSLMGNNNWRWSDTSVQLFGAPCYRWVGTDISQLDEVQ